MGLAVSDPIKDWADKFDAAQKRYHDALDDPTKQAAIADMKALGFTEGDALFYLTHRGKNVR